MLAFRNYFDKCFETVALRAVLLLWNNFIQYLDDVVLQSLSFGDALKQSLVNVAFSWQLAVLAFQGRFQIVLECVALLGNSRSLSVGSNFHRSSEDVAVPGSFQSLSFRGCFNQNLAQVTLPGSAQSLSFLNWFKIELSECGPAGQLAVLELRASFQWEL